MNRGRREGFESLKRQSFEAWNAGDKAAAGEGFSRALRLAEEKGDKPGAALCWHRLGAVALADGDLAGAGNRFEKALLLYRELEDGHGYAKALHQLGTICLERRNYKEARRLARAAMDIQHQLGDRAGIARSLYQIASAYMAEQNVPEAAEGFRHAIKVMHSVDDTIGQSRALHHLGGLAESLGFPLAAFQFCAAAAALMQEIHHPDTSAALTLMREQAKRAGLAPEGLDQDAAAALQQFRDDGFEALIAQVFN